VAVILFVPFARRLDLSGLGDGFFLPPINHNRRLIV
jgi:hypothetical protein